MAPASPSRSHWYVLATVGLMVLAPCGWLLVKWHEVRVKREAFMATLITGSHVLVAYGAPWGPVWLRKLMGDEWFMEVEHASCGSGTTEAELEHLVGEFPRLRQLWLVETKITGAGLEHLKGLTQLQDLEFHKARITDAGLEQLKGLTQLQFLELCGTDITDAGLVHLRGLTNLRSLDITGTQVTYPAVERLRQALPNCSVEY